VVLDKSETDVTFVFRNGNKCGLHKLMYATKGFNKKCNEVPRRTGDGTVRSNTPTKA
jgi:hypothetical protein